MMFSDEDIDPWPIPKVYLKFAPPEVVKDYGNEVCALIYHIIRGIVDDRPEHNDVPPCLQCVPAALRNDYGTELPEVLGRAALGVLQTTDAKSGVPAYLKKVTQAEVEEWGEDLLRLTGGIAEAFRVYPFLRRVPENLLLDFADADTVEFVSAVVRGMVEGQSHPEWSRPHTRYVTPAMQSNWVELVDILGRLLSGILKKQTATQGKQDITRYLSQKERDDFDGFFPFVAAICDGWLHNNPPLPPQLHHSEKHVRWEKGGVILGDYVIERELGRGGMGRVWLVKSNSTGRRFAVKQSLIKGDKHRKAFLAELQTWIDLPEHPNLVPCRFFRTLGDEVLIFADYIQGGSLQDWIDSRKLYEGGPEKALERILDVAIQFAWGLHCIHKLGMVHQDVKPSNVLMADNLAVQGVRPMVSDYGLARARAIGGEQHMLGMGKNTLVSSGRYTPAFCSPEQVQGLALTKNTDHWSWGVSVLEMFTGEVTWASGATAPEILEQFVEEKSQFRTIPDIPKDVITVLRESFKANPDQRLINLHDVVQRFKVIYHSVVGEHYTRILREIEQRPMLQIGVGERRTRNASKWSDPKVWLQRALQEEGRDPASADDIVNRQGVSRRGQLVAELLMCEAALQIYESLVNKGRTDLEFDLSVLCMEAGFVHETADDYHGAVLLFSRAIDICEKLELAGCLIQLYTYKAAAVHALGDNRGAVSLYDRAIEICRPLVLRGQKGLRDDLANLYVNKGVSLYVLGDASGAIVLYDMALAIREQLVNEDGRWEFMDALASVWQNKAVALRTIGDSCSALTLYDRALEIRKRLVNFEGHQEMAPCLADLYMNKGIIVGAQGDKLKAIELFNLALEIRERLVNNEGRWELADNLASLYVNKAHACALSDIQESIVLYDRALAIRERLVNQEGRQELASSLAMLYMSKGSAFCRLQNFHSALMLHDQAVVILERLVDKDGHGELTGDLAHARACRGLDFALLGETDKGLHEISQAKVVLRAESERTGREDIKSVLEMLKQFR